MLAVGGCAPAGGDLDILARGNENSVRKEVQSRGKFCVRIDVINDLALTVRRCNGLLPDIGKLSRESATM